MSRGKIKDASPALLYCEGQSTGYIMPYIFVEYLKVGKTGEETVNGHFRKAQSNVVQGKLYPGNERCNLGRKYPE
jgi:hypothetical protein